MRVWVRESGEGGGCGLNFLGDGGHVVIIIYIFLFLASVVYVAIMTGIVQDDKIYTARRETPYHVKFVLLPRLERHHLRRYFGVKMALVVSTDI